MKKRLLTVCATAIIIVGVAIVALRHVRSDQHALVAQASSATPVTATDIRARFAVLAKQHTNQCGLRAHSLETLAHGGQLQGACCSAMDYGQYAEQMQGLKRYSALAQIPRDPYDIPVSLAKRLIGYDDSIALNESEQAVYGRAVELSGEHGPCCCHCWRWNAFEGQAKFLISRRAFTAPQIAEIWDLEDGCGGDKA